MKEMNITIKNADVWASTWITNFFYRNLDNENLVHLNIKNVHKSKHSIEFEIFIAYLMAKAVEMRLERKMLDYLKKWLKNRKQTKLEIYINNDRLESDG